MPVDGSPRAQSQQISETFTGTKPPGLHRPALFPAAPEAAQFGFKRAGTPLTASCPGGQSMSLPFRKAQPPAAPLSNSWDSGLTSDMCEGWPLPRPFLSTAGLQVPGARRLPTVLSDALAMVVCPLWDAWGHSPCLAQGNGWRGKMWQESHQSLLVFT